MSGTGAEFEAAHWAGCWLVDEGDAGRAAGTRAADCAGRSRRRRRFLQSHVLAGPAQGEGERSAGVEVWRVGEQEEEMRGMRGEEWSESRRSCGC